MSDPKIFDTIDALIAAVPLTPESAAKVLGARLVRDADSDTAAAQAYALSDKVRGGPYESIDLRMPDEDIGDGMVFLSVTLRSDEGVDEDAICERFGTDFRTEVPSPRFKPGTVPVYLIFEHEWGTLSFGVTADEERKLVRFILSARAA
jgi:hypothetical protein